MLAAVFVIASIVTSKFVKKNKSTKPVGPPVKMHYDPQSGEWSEGDGGNTPQLMGEGAMVAAPGAVAGSVPSNDVQHEEATYDYDDEDDDGDGLDYNEPPEEDDLDLNLDIESDYDELDVDEEILDEDEYEEELARYLSGTRRNKRRLRRLRHYLMDN